MPAAQPRPPGLPRLHASYSSSAASAQEQNLRKNRRKKSTVTPQHPASGNAASLTSDAASLYGFTVESEKSKMREEDSDGMASASGSTDGVNPAMRALTRSRHRRRQTSLRHQHAAKLLDAIQHPPHAVSSHSSAMSAASSSLLHNPRDTPRNDANHTTVLGIGGVQRKGGVRDGPSPLQLLFGEGEEAEALFLESRENFIGNGGDPLFGRSSTPSPTRPQRRRRHRHRDVAAAGAAGATSFNIFDTRRGATLFVEAGIPLPPTERKRKSKQHHSHEERDETPPVSAAAAAGSTPEGLEIAHAFQRSGAEQEEEAAAGGIKAPIPKSDMATARPSRQNPANEGESGGGVPLEYYAFPQELPEENKNSDAPSENTLGTTPNPVKKNKRKSTSTPDSAAAGSSLSPAATPNPLLQTIAPAAKTTTPVPSSSSVSTSTTTSTTATAAARMAQERQVPRVLHAGLPPLRAHLYYEKDGEAIPEGVFLDEEDERKQYEEREKMKYRQGSNRVAAGGAEAPMAQIRLDPETGVPLLLRPNAVMGNDPSGNANVTESQFKGNYFRQEHGIRLRTQRQIASGGVFDPRRIHMGDPYGVWLADNEEMDEAYRSREQLAHGSSAAYGPTYSAGLSSMHLREDEREDGDNWHYTNPLYYRRFYHKILAGMRTISVFLCFFAFGASCLTCIVAFAPMRTPSVNYLALLTNRSEVEDKDIGLYLRYHEQATLTFYILSDAQPAFYIFLTLLCILTHFAQLTAPLVELYWKNEEEKSREQIREGQKKGLPFLLASDHGDRTPGMMSRGVDPGSATTTANVGWKMDFFDEYQRERLEDEQRRRATAEAEAKQIHKAQKKKRALRRQRRRRQRRLLRMRSLLGIATKKDSAVEGDGNEGKGAAGPATANVGAAPDQEEEPIEGEEDEEGDDDGAEDPFDPARIKEERRREAEAYGDTVLKRNFNFLAFQQQIAKERKREIQLQHQRELLQMQYLAGAAHSQSNDNSMWLNTSDEDMRGHSVNGTRGLLALRNVGGAILRPLQRLNPVGRSSRARERNLRHLRMRRTTTMPIAFGQQQAAALEGSLYSPLSSPLPENPSSSMGLGGFTPGTPLHVATAAAEIGSSVGSEVENSPSPQQQGQWQRRQQRPSSFGNDGFCVAEDPIRTPQRYSGVVDNVSSSRHTQEETASEDNYHRSRRFTSVVPPLSFAAAAVIETDNGTDTSTGLTLAKGHPDLARRRKTAFGLTMNTAEGKSQWMTSMPSSISSHPGSAMPYRGERIGAGRSGRGAYGSHAEQGGSTHPDARYYTQQQQHEDHSLHLSPSEFTSEFLNPKHFSSLWHRLCGQLLSLYYTRPTLFFCLDSLFRPRLWCLGVVLYLSVQELAFLAKRPSSFILRGSGQGEWLSWEPQKTSTESGALNDVLASGGIQISPIDNTDTTSSKHLFIIMTLIYMARLILLGVACLMDIVF